MQLSMLFATSSTSKCMRASKYFCRCYTSKIPTDLPDYNTNVNVHEHKLTRPQAMPGKGTKDQKWEGLKELKLRTTVYFPNFCLILL